MGCAAGILFRDSEVTSARVKAMLAASPHRGGNTRVAVLGRAVLGVAEGDGVGVSDLYEDQGLVVAFSGFLDNLDELSGALRAEGHGSPARTPAQVIGASWVAFGTDTPQRLRGAYQVLVTDGRTLWAFRDQLGSRPLFFRADRRGVHVGAEAKQVVAGAQISYSPDAEMLEDIFYGRGSAPDRCALTGVERLLPAHLLTARDESERSFRYWAPGRNLERSRLSAGELKERFDFLWTRAVDRCLVGDDVVSLSGGVDSPAIAAYGAALYPERFGRPLPALSTVYPDQPAVDESYYIRAVADELGMPLHTYESTASPTDRIRDWVRLVDSPIPVISLAETVEHLTLARQLGYRNTLTGEMAEFVFDMRRHLLGHLLTRGKLAAAFRELSGRRAHGEPLKRQLRAVVRSFLPASYFMWRRNRSGVHLADGRERRRPRWLDASRMSPDLPVSGWTAWRDEQLSPFDGPTLAFEADDAIQSLTGVSVRRPWADLDLWEFFLGLPADVKFPRRGSKPLVRDLLRGRVPDVILDREDKTIFNDAIFDRIDYGALRQWLIDPGDFRMPGVDYALLDQRIKRQECDLWEFFWAKDLAAVHAFLSTC
jgi:asparagine synthase (glutamine-hydrolysing)